MDVCIADKRINYGSRYWISSVSTQKLGINLFVSDPIVGEARLIVHN